MINEDPRNRSMERRGVVADWNGKKIYDLHNLKESDIVISIYGHFFLLTLKVYYLGLGHR